MGVKNFKQLEFALKNAFFKIRKDIKKLEETNKETVKDLSVVRENLLEFNSIKKKLEEIEKKIGNVDVKEDLGEIGGLEKKEGFLSKVFFWKRN